MSTNLSDIIEYLSYNNSLAIGSVYETIKVILQEYGSISITVSNDESISLSIFFSNDGLNFDYFVNYSLKIGAQAITSVILGKWVKIRIQNSSRFTANVRFTTYAQTIPIALQAQIVSRGDTLPSINISNQSKTQFNELLVSQRKPITSTNFFYTTTSGGLIVTPDRSLTEINNGNLLTNPSNVIGNALCLSNIYNEVPGSYHIVHSTPVLITNNNPVYIVMACGFLHNGYIDALTYGYDTMLCGIGYTDNTNQIIDGFFVGYPSAPVPPNPIVDEICMIVYASSVQHIIPKSQWFFDRLDGLGSSGVLLNEQKLNTWRLRVGITDIFLEYQDGSSEEWIKCHRDTHTNSSTVTQVLSDSYAFMMYTSKTSLASGNIIVNGCGPLCSVAEVGVELGNDNRSRLQSYNISASVTTAGPSEFTIISIRNGPSFNTKNNRSLIFFTSLYATTTGGITPVVFQMYKNGTLQGPIVWTVKDAQYEPTETSINTHVIGTGGNVSGMLIAADGSQEVDITEHNTSLARDEILSFVCSTGSATTVTMLINYNIVM